jgi:hypothetical protein
LVLNIPKIKRKKEETGYVSLHQVPVLLSSIQKPTISWKRGAFPLSLSTCMPLPSYFIGIHIFRKGGGRVSEVILVALLCVINNCTDISRKEGCPDRLYICHCISLKKFNQLKKWGAIPPPPGSYEPVRCIKIGIV